MPFSQCSGVLEWCSGTVPIGEFLVDPNKGAHKRFRPQDWTNLCCRKKMMVLLRHIQCSHTLSLGNQFLMNHSYLYNSWSLTITILQLGNCQVRIALFITGSKLQPCRVNLLSFCRRKLRDLRLMRNSWPTLRCARTSGRSSGISAWNDSWIQRCGWRNGSLTPAAWPPPL